MSTHTPGPRRVDPNYDADIQTADGRLEIAMVDISDIADNVAPEAEAAANARLIAAAPELLEALAALLAHLEQDEQDAVMGIFGAPTYGAIAAARAAIAKATGGAV